jgi:hypothetical protein
VSSSSTDEQSLSAWISVIENGLFHIMYNYRCTASDLQRLPNYQAGASLSDVKQRIQNKASQIGFGAIVWDRNPAGFAD